MSSTVDAVVEQLRSHNTPQDTLLAILCSLLALLQNDTIDVAVRAAAVNNDRIVAVAALFCEGSAPASDGSAASVERQLSPDVRAAAASVLRERKTIDNNNNNNNNNNINNNNNNNNNEENKCDTKAIVDTEDAFSSTSNALDNSLDDSHSLVANVSSESLEPNVSSDSLDSFVPKVCSAMIRQARNEAIGRVSSHLSSPWRNAVEEQWTLALKRATQRFSALDAIDELASGTVNQHSLSELPPPLTEGANVPPLPPLRWLAMRKDFVLLAALAAIDNSIDNVRKATTST